MYDAASRQSKTGGCVLKKIVGHQIYRTWKIQQIKEYLIHELPLPWLLKKVKKSRPSLPKTY